MKKVVGFIVALIAAFVLVMPSAKADGAITAQEQRILDALGGVFMIENSSVPYGLPEEYLTQAENQLKQHDYSTAQVEAVLADIDAVREAIYNCGLNPMNVEPSFEGLVKALPASVKAQIKANVQKAADTLGLKIVFTSTGIEVVEDSKTPTPGAGTGTTDTTGNTTIGNISTGSPVKQTGANYITSVVAAASLLVVAAGALVVGKKAKRA